jgi:hypothetical protein
MFVFRGVGCIFTEMIAGTYLYLCFVFRGVGCIFTEMIAGTYLYLCFFSGELDVYLQR